MDTLYEENGSRKIPPGVFPPKKFPLIKLPSGNKPFPSENCHPENSRLEYSHSFR